MKILGKIVLLVAVILIILAATGQFKKDNQIATDAEPITIGAILPLTGIGAGYGEAQENAIRMAVDDINKDGGINGQPLEIIIEDDTTSARSAVSAFTKLTSVDNVDYIVGGVWDTLAAPLVPLLDEQQTVLVSPTFVPEMFSIESDYFLSMTPSVQVFEESFRTYLDTYEEPQSIALIATNVPWGNLHREFFAEVIRDTEHTIVSEIILPEFDTNDLNTELTELKANHDADIIVATVNSSDTVTLLNRNTEYDINADILSHFFTISVHEDGLVSDDVLSTTTIYNLSQPRESFQKKYTNLFDMPPTNGAENAYDAVFAIKEMIEINGDSPVVPEDMLSLRKQISFDGVTGAVEFPNSYFSESISGIFQKFEDGEFVELK